MRKIAVAYLTVLGVAILIWMFVAPKWEGAAGDGNRAALEEAYGPLAGWARPGLVALLVVVLATVLAALQTMWWWAKRQRRGRRDY